MVVAESLLVFSAVKSAVALCKGAIQTSNDVKGLYSGLDQLFKSREDAAKAIAAKKKKAEPKSKLRKLFTKTTHENEEDDLSLGAIAALVIEQRQLERSIENLARSIDNKYGFGTFAEIEDLRNKKLEERKVQKAKDKKIAKQKALATEETHERIYRYFLEFLKIVGVILLGLGMAYTVWINRCQGTGCI